ncbi:probable LRR receptor-like serine/threonine-protein kinase At3g47570 [Macadamia integrifolia]|uniref:probable LRR receptor-like serine/threonine-protein kinase At3g47570 n=1 Tax=Macadamia integrifolia TaxID=60698 RepID=UPI001C4F69FF|nr:probable LRR receptor-like serine/threonine-protein kinase At3g47570 [Macadamia integrifolia]
MDVQVSVLGDAFSYGVILLEMFTGKSPIDNMFKDGRSLHEYVAAAWPERLMEIADPLLFLEEEEEIRNNREESPIVHERSRSGINAREQIRESLLLIIQIGLSCSNPSPRDRMTMKDVGNKLHVVRDLIL